MIHPLKLQIRCHATDLHIKPIQCAGARNHYVQQPLLILRTEAFAMLDTECPEALPHQAVLFLCRPKDSRLKTVTVRGAVHAHENKELDRTPKTLGVGWSY